MTSENMEQVYLLEQYALKQGKTSVLDSLFYVECISCKDMFKVASKASQQRRKYCDSCKADKVREYRENHKCTNETLGIKKGQRYDHK